MVKANELRIGNYFLGGLDEILEVTSVSGEGVGYKDGDAVGGCTIPSLRPIPLTEECLSNFGFKLYKSPIGHFFERSCGSNEISFNEATHSLFIGETKTTKVIMLGIVDSVHQLQNLYFALTGEELTLKK